MDPGNKYVHVYTLNEEGKYGEEPEVYLAGDSIECSVLKGLSIGLDSVFRE